MVDNVIMSVKQNVKRDADLDKIGELLNEALDGIDKMYSYIVYAEYDEDCKITGYIIQYNFSQNESYNTLCTSDVIKNVIEILKNSKNVTKRVVGYGQPPLEIIVEAYDNLVKKLSKQMLDRWRQYDYEDLCQICRLVMVKLYRKGYYLNKRLLRRAFENYIWCEVKNDIGKPQMVSLEDVFYSHVGGESEDLTFSDIVADDEAIEAEELKTHEEVERLIFEEVRDVVIDLIGIRQWNELLRDYGNKHTTSWSRKTLLKLKRQLENLGITRRSFNHKYYD